jgi:hypothetical protein
MPIHLEVNGPGKLGVTPGTKGQTADPFVLIPRELVEIPENNCREPFLDSTLKLVLIYLAATDSMQ